MKKTELSVNDINFTIYSDSIVFGDGSHETTKLVLELLSKCEIRNKFVMDIGTGTGILSVFSSLSGASRVVAIDANGGALEWARKNFKTNNVNVEIELTNLTDEIDDKADIIVANLPMPEQVENLKTVKKNLNENGILIVSWFNQVPLEDFNKEFEVIGHIDGREYDAYVLKYIK